MARSRILLVTPPIHGLTAYGFRLWPHGMLRVAGRIQHACDLEVPILLSEFSPVPGTRDGERCRQWADVEEPLSHNKTAFTIRRLGVQQVNRMKELCRQLDFQIQRGEQPW